MTHKIKAKALSIVTKRQQDRQEAIYGADCDAETENSTTSLQEQADAEAWLASLKVRSEEIFYQQI